MIPTLTKRFSYNLLDDLAPKIILDDPTSLSKESIADGLPYFFG